MSKFVLSVLFILAIIMGGVMVFFCCFLFISLLGDGSFYAEEIETNEQTTHNPLQN